MKAMWGLATVRGVFREFGGRLDVRPSAVAGGLTIEAASLDTRNKRRDKHLRLPRGGRPRLELARDDRPGRHASRPAHAWALTATSRLRAHADR